MDTAAQSFVLSLNWFDWVLVTIIAISTFYGLFRGFIKEAVTITAWSIAIWLSYVYAPSLAVYLEPHIETSSMRVALMVLAVFIAVLCSSAILRRGFTLFINKVGLVGLDYILGAMFGVLRGAVVAMLLMVALMHLGFDSDSWWKKSYMVHRLLGVMDVIPEHLPSDVKGMYHKITLR